MNYLGRVFGNLRGLYSGINGATLTGAIDVVVVEQEDGSYKCSPFHVRFGKLGVLRSREKVVDIEINGVSVPVRMKLGDSGEAFFVQEVYGDEFDDEFLATSPLPASPQLSDSDNNRAKRGETEESADDKETLSLIGGPVILKIGKDDTAVEVGSGLNAAVSTLTEPVPLIAKGDDSKNRKRRKKRRRNQGSKSNIILDPIYAPDNDQTETPETMFAMDEELPGLTGALKALEASGHNNQSLNHPNRSYHRDFFSDTEVEATSTPQNSRPSTPIQSDSEYEISKEKIQKAGEDEEVGKWPWGELPSTGNTTPAITPMGLGPDSSLTLGKNNMSPSDYNPLSSDDESSVAAGRTENKSLLGGMFSFMKRNSSGPGATTTTTDSTTGIYLDDLNLESMDPEVAALYFPNFGRDLKESSKRGDQDEDVESGKGSSLPQSPAPGSSPRSSQLSVYMEDEKEKRRHDSADSRGVPQFEAISICGSNLGLFEQSQLTFDELVENPEVILNTPPENIVVKLDGKLVPWSAALPQLLSTIFFKRPLPPPLHDRLIGQFTKKDESGQVIMDSHSIQRSNSMASNSGKDYKKPGYSWFPWRRSTNPAENDVEQQQGGESQGQGTHPHEFDTGIAPNTIKAGDIVDESSPLLRGSSEKETANISASSMRSNNNNLNNMNSKDSSSSSDESEGGGGQKLENTKASCRNSRSASVQPSPAHKPIPPPLNVSASININIGNINPEKYKKSMRLTSDQIAALGLLYGRNEAVFSVTTAYQGTTVARCHIYLWRYDDRVVVSDIDGTITKSDVLGHILPIIGNDWAQSGVAQLFTQIQDNGYKMLYLSARAIGQAAITRDYLRSIRQDDVTLPDGPLLLNPTSLMSALHREVIEKKPEEFKIACLRDIQTLFPTNPFYAGYGNKINDVWAYRAVEIAIPRIFTINHKGELRHALTNTFQSSYTSLVELAEFIFPPYRITPFIQEHGEDEQSAVSFSTTDGYSSFEFWRVPFPQLPGLEDDKTNLVGVIAHSVA